MKSEPLNPDRPTLQVLKTLEQQNSFRECVFAENITCMELEVEEFVPRSYGYSMAINAPNPPQTGKNIYTETIFITGNQTNTYKTVYLHYWIIG